MRLSAAFADRLGARALLVDTPIRYGFANSRRRESAMPPADLALKPQTIERAAIERDVFCCRLCGFVSRRYQVAFAPGGERRDIDRLITACLFCFQCSRLEWVEAMQSGTVIWAPEVKQVELHHMVRELYMARVGVDDASRAAACLERLDERRAEAQRRCATHEPTRLLELLADHAAAGSPLAGLRLLPADHMLIPQRYQRIDIFPEQLAFWLSEEGPYGCESPPRLSWLELASERFDIADADSTAGTDPDACGPQPIANATVAASAADGQPPEFVHRRDPRQPFCFQILSWRDDRNPPDYAQVGEYRLLDVTEPAEITATKLDNLVAILNGELVPHDMSMMTKKRMIFEIRDSAESDVVDFMTEDAEGVITKNAICSFERGVFTEEG